MIYRSRVSVRCVPGNLRPWRILPGASSSITLYTFDRFHLEGDTPYDLYVYAARSNQVSQDALLPPEAPVITIWYCNDINSPFKIHRDCLGAGPWINQSERKYESS